MTADPFVDIAPARALGVQVAEWADGRVALTAPLAPNLNDKGTAFAGSINSLLVLAGWAAITLSLKDHGLAADVMVVTSQTEYTAALRGELEAEATISADETARAVQELKERGRSRVVLQSALPGFATMTASYAVVRRRRP